MNDRIGRVAIPLEAAAEGGTAIETAAQLAARANAPPGTVQKSDAISGGSPQTSHQGEEIRFAADSSLEEAVSSEPGDRNSGAI